VPFRTNCVSKTCGEGRTITEIASMALDLLKNADLRAAVVCRITGARNGAAFVSSSACTTGKILCAAGHSKTKGQINDAYTIKSVIAS
jgi:hypothetical protein